jgi:hypothetical protein
MQATTCVHASLPHAIGQEADGVLYHPVAFHPTHGVFSPQAHGRDLTSRRVFRGCEFPATRLLLGLENRDTRPQESLEALLLLPTPASGQGRPGALRHALLRRVAFRSGAQEGHVPGLLAHQEGCARGMLLCAAVIFFRFFRSFRPLDGPFRPSRPTRGGVEGPAGVCCASRVANASAVRAGRSSGAATVRFTTACHRCIHVLAGDGDIPHRCPWSAWSGWCFKELRMQRNVSAIVGQGQVPYGRSRRLVRGGPAMVRVPMDASKACSQWGNSA